MWPRGGFPERSHGTVVEFRGARAVPVDLALESTRGRGLSGFGIYCNSSSRFRRPQLLQDAPGGWVGVNPDLGGNPQDGYERPDHRLHRQSSSWGRIIVEAITTHIFCYKTANVGKARIQVQEVPSVLDLGFPSERDRSPGPLYHSG